MKRRTEIDRFLQKKRALYQAMRRRQRLAWLKKIGRPKSRPPRPIFEVHAPHFIELEAGNIRRTLLNFISQLRKSTTLASEVGGELVIDFKSTKRVAAAGMLMLFAEVKRLIHFFGVVKFSIKCARAEPLDSPQTKRMKLIVNQVLDHIGFLACFGSTLRFPSESEDVIHWNYIEGTSPVNMEACLPILNQVETCITTESSHALDSGLGEILDNAVYHGFFGVRQDGLEIDDAQAGRRQWHLFSRIESDYVTVVAADLGVGIPVTLPAHNTQWESVRERLEHRVAAQYKKDGFAIQYAMKHGATRTGEVYRGTGLPYLAQTIQKVPGANLTILSNFGAYTLEDGRWRVPPDDIASINGTLISWRFPLSRSIPLQQEQGFYGPHQHS